MDKSKVARFYGPRYRCHLAGTVHSGSKHTLSGYVGSLTPYRKGRSAVKPPAKNAKLLIYEK